MIAPAIKDSQRDFRTVLPNTTPELARDINIKIGTDYKNSPVRVEYEAKVTALNDQLEQILVKNNGVITEADAKALYEARRSLGIEFKDQTPTPLRDFIYERNITKYDGDPLGPTWEWMMDNYDGDYLEITEAAARPAGDVNLELAKFDTWLANQDVEYLLQSELDILRGN